MTGTAGQQRVPREYFSGCAFPLPPLAEQKRIVEKVDELMALCDRLQTSQETRDNLRQKLRESAIDSLMNAETNEELQKSWAIVRDMATDGKVQTISGDGTAQTDRFGNTKLS